MTTSFDAVRRSGSAEARFVELTVVCLRVRTSGGRLSAAAEPVAAVICLAAAGVMLPGCCR